jgi:AbrB family looped-hinge helix DNA binding protein
VYFLIWLDYLLKYMYSMGMRTSTRAPRTTVTERGQTAVPAAIRRRFGIKPGQKLEWIEDGGRIHLHPVPKDPLKAFRGSAQGEGLLQTLLRQRRIDAARE